VSASRPDDPAWWAFAALSPVFATLFFSVRTTAVVAAATVATVILLQFAHREEVGEPGLIASIAFVAIFAPILVLAGWHRARIERHRLKELQMGERAAAESRRLEALGRLAGGVAHDFNNLLTVVAANADMLAGESRPAAETVMISEIQAAADRAGHLTAQLLAFARQQPLEQHPVDIVATLNDLAPLLQLLLGSTIELTVTVRASRAVVLGDRTQIEQVILNLAGNARAAMESGGRLAIDVDRSDGDEGDVVVTVRDNGHGMDAETLARSFEPFFTTNESQGGTGLGLAIVKGVIDQLGGSIEVDSQPGQGTTFRVVLPAAADESPARPQTRSPVAIPGPATPSARPSW
jgi:signal transduction histidine kinase